MKFVDINGITIHYGCAGSDINPTVVFANSLGTDFRIWQEVAAGLVPDYQVILYDKRGHGLSDCPPGACDMSDHVHDLLGLLDHLGIDSAVVCGVSVGGMIAQGLAAVCPERVRALVLCDTAHLIGPPGMWDQRIAAIEREGLGAIVDDVMERWFTPGFREREQAALAGYRNMFCRTPVEGYSATCMAIRDADFSDSSALLRLPALCICGQEDGATTPEQVRSLATLIPEARFELIPQCGHLPSVEQPTMLLNRMRLFFDAHGIS
jgi:3-oxoadipate enol-lactonase